MVTYRYILSIIIGFYFVRLSYSAHSSSSQILPFYEMKLNLITDLGLAEVELDIDVPQSFLQEGSLPFLLSSHADILTLGAQKLIAYSKNEAGSELVLYTLEFEEKTRSSISIHLNYTIKIPEIHQVNRISEEWIELNVDSFWHPILISFSRFHYRMQLTLEQDYQIVSGDKIIDDSLNKDIRVVESVIPRLDISFAATKSFFQRKGEYAHVYSTNSATDIERLLELSESALVFLKEYLNKPEDFDKNRLVVESIRDEVGYARENYVVLSKLNNMNPVMMSSFLAHEFSHYWFANTNPQSSENWLDESFAEFLSMIYIRKKYGVVEYEKILTDKLQKIKGQQQALNSFQGRPSYAAMYILGPIVLHHFEQYIGVNQFKYLIQQMVDKKTSTTDGLLALVNELFGAEAEEKLKELRSKIF